MLKSRIFFTFAPSGYSMCVFSCMHVPLLQGYKVYYTLSPDMPITLWTLHEVNSGQLTTISSLVTNRTYTISMLAFTSVGSGPHSEAIKVKTQQGGRYCSYESSLLLLPIPLVISEFGLTVILMIIILIFNQLLRITVCRI